MSTVSIIIPVYNVLPYINQCLDSVRQQTYSNWECIIVDDGSTDGCSSFIDEYIKHDTRFTVIHKQNAGLAAARQTGIENASGEYIVHIDSDDYVETSHVESLVDYAEKENAEIVLADYYVDSNGVQTVKHQEPASLDKQTLICETLYAKHHAGLWCKIFKRNLIVENRIPAAPYSFYEDMFTFFSCLYYAHKIAYLPIATYHYRYNQQSLTHEENMPKRINMYEQCMCNLKEILRMYKYENNPQIMEALYSRVNFEKERLMTFWYKYHIVKPYIRKYFKNSQEIIVVDSFRAWAYKNALAGFIFPFIVFKVNHALYRRLRSLFCTNEKNVI